MDERKICFISCVNDAQEYGECLRYLHHLQIPDGMEAEMLSVEQAESMAAGYNAAMGSSDAKYKIYLHQDVLALKRDLVPALLGIFRGDPRIGLIGLAGCKELPATGVWWEAGDVYEHVAQATSPELLEVTQKGSMAGDLADMQAVDGILMATQYDLPWREDVFRGWHFYDASASMEFRRAGYRVVIPRQEEPWCLHECGEKFLDEAYRHWKDVFCETYGIAPGQAGIRVRPVRSAAGRRTCFGGNTNES